MLPSKPPQRQFHCAPVKALAIPWFAQLAMLTDYHVLRHLIRDPILDSKKQGITQSALFDCILFNSIVEQDTGK